VSLRLRHNGNHRLRLHLLVDHLACVQFTDYAQESPLAGTMIKFQRSYHTREKKYGSSITPGRCIGLSLLVIPGGLYDTNYYCRAVDLPNNVLAAAERLWQSSRIYKRYPQLQQLTRPRDWVGNELLINTGRI